MKRRSPNWMLNLARIIRTLATITAFFGTCTILVRTYFLCYVTNRKDVRSAVRSADRVRV